LWTCVIAVLLPVAVSAQTPDVAGKLDPLLRVRAAQLSGRSRVLVQFHGTPDPRVITRTGGVAGEVLHGLNAQVAEVSNLHLTDLARAPHVARVLPDRETFPTMERTGAAIGAALARQEFGLTGRGIGVAVIDSGVTTWHDDLSLIGSSRTARVSPRVVHFRDFTSSRPSSVWLSEVPSDEYGHGTHVAGIIAGTGFDSNGARTGIAPRANLVALKVLDGQGHGYISDVIDAIDYAIKMKDAFNIRVINLSVASGVFESYTTDPLAQATKRAVDAGIVVVAAAGNLGATEEGDTQFGGITCPGNAPWVLTVGAANHEGTTPRRDDTLAAFSSRGPTWIDFSAKPDLVAPGVGIESLAGPHSAFYNEYPEYLLDGTRPTAFKPYLSLTGTSMAALVVAGTVALMLEANPDLTPNAVKALLQYTAEVRAGQHFLAQGAGLLNARGAIRMARFFATPEARTPRPGDTIEREWITWSRHIVWGNQRIDGGLPLPGSSAWAAGVTWGDELDAAGRPLVWGVDYADNIVWSTFSEDNIVWGNNDDDNIVWSTRDHGDNIVWSTRDDENIVWSTAHVQNVVWGTDCGGANCRRTLWGARAADGTLWGTAAAGDNIVWSTDNADNIVWSTNQRGDDNIVWSTNDDNIVWSTNLRRRQ
jgi:serine protease AprX